MAQEKAANVVDLGATRAAIAKAATAGAFLADARRSRGFSLADISDATKIKIEQLQAIEGSDVSGLPATPYAVGFVKVYATFLGLDPDPLTVQFKSDIGADQPVEDEIGAGPATNAMNAASTLPIGPLLGIAAILVFGFWVAFQIMGTSGSRDADRVATVNNGGVRLGDAAAPIPQPRIKTPLPDEVTVDMANAEREIDLPATMTGQATLPGDETVDIQILDAAPGETNDVPSEIIAETSPAIEQTVVELPVIETETVDEPTPVAQPEIVGADSLNASQSIGLAPASNNDVHTDSSPGDVDAIEITDAPSPVIATPAPVVVSARLTRSPSPRYPSRCARNASPLDSVTVMFDVTAVGRTANARVVDSTNSCFDAAAISAINRWRFEPRTVDGAARPEPGRQATLRFE